MKTFIRKRSGRTGSFVAFITVLILAAITGYEIWAGQFVTLVYFAMVLLSPLLVLLTTDFIQAKRPLQR